jgi:uncharacterized sodium:solute symporter family permease YidK
VAAPIDPALQAKGLRLAAKIVVAGGLLIGIGMPALFTHLGIEVARMSSGFDAIWFVMLAIMVGEFVLAWIMWRRATAIERTLMGLPPRGE